MKYFTKLTSKESVRGLMCLNIQIKSFGGELLLHLEEDYMHLKELCTEIIGKHKVLFSDIPKEYTEIKINSLLLSKDKIVELDEPWVSLRVKCLRQQLPHIIDLHNTWWKYLIIGGKKYQTSLVKESMHHEDESYKHFRTIKKLVQYTRREEDYEYVLKLYDYILDNKQEVITELNSRWLISITESLCKLKDDGHQFVLLHSLMRMIQVYNSKLFMVGFFNTINQNGDVVEMADIKGSDYATHIPSGGWSELWDGLQARFENDYVFSTIGKNIDGVMTNKICKMIFREFISRINPIVMTEVSKSDILNDK
tara:strand:- start:19 stop:948 length:930 start_codon:yes stop_codon:yes gene_type:complete